MTISVKNSLNRWSGRFSKDIDGEMKRFNSSIAFDYKLAKYDLVGTIAHIKTLRKAEILTEEECISAINVCNELIFDFERSESFEEKDFWAKLDVEDIHFFIKDEITKKIGDLAEKIHTGRSRNDQVALDLTLYTQDAAKQLLHKICNVIKGFLQIAENNLTTIMPAYTHSQTAQPTSLAHYFCCYAEMLLGDAKRFSSLNFVSPIGAGSICGSSIPLDIQFTRENLNFTEEYLNSMNAVSNRDFILDFCYACSVLMMHLSRLCEDIIIYSSSEYSYFILDDAFCTRSSLMPNKKTQT